MNGKYLVAALNSENSGKTVVKGYDTAGKERLNFEISGNIIGMLPPETPCCFIQTDIYICIRKRGPVGTQEAGFTD